MSILSNLKHLSGLKDMRKKLVRNSSKTLIRPIKKAQEGDVFSLDDSEETFHFYSLNDPSYFDEQLTQGDTLSQPNYFDLQLSRPSPFDVPLSPNNPVRQMTTIIDDRNNNDIDYLIDAPIEGKESSLIIAPLSKKDATPKRVLKLEKAERPVKKSGGHYSSVYGQDLLGGYKSKLSDDKLKSMSLQDILTYIKADAKITNGYRTAEQARRFKSGLNSWHHRTDKWGDHAHDVVPTKGTFNDLLNQLYSSSDFVRWLLLKDYGVLEETQQGVPGSINERVGATGNNLHIGPDTGAKRLSLRRIKK